MAKETLFQIQETEIKAKNLIENAQLQAESIIEEVVQETELEFTRLTEECKRYELEEIENSEKNALIQSKEYEKQTQGLCEDLTQELLQQKSKAVELTIKMIIG